jgi:hypothetical protein
VKLVAGIVLGQKLQAVGEYLPPFQQPLGADDDVPPGFFTVSNSARSNGNLRLALAHFETLGIRKGASLAVDNFSPPMFLARRTSKQFQNLTRMTGCHLDLVFRITKGSCSGCERV